jgi:hypothetical protein|nr:MAG TPA: Sigma-70, region 4 [Caudoviricetes sp.]
MTKNQLKELKSLIKEAEHLQSELNDTLLFPSCNEYVADSAQDYRTGKPHTFKVEGYGQENYAKLRQKIYDKRNRIREKIEETEDWLNSVSDTKIRRILRLQYWDGLTQEEIAKKFDCDVRTIKRWLKNFWENV